MAETISPFDLIPDELPANKDQLHTLVQEIERTYFADDTLARGSALSPWGRGVEWRVAPSHSSAVTEGTHLQMVPEPERALKPEESGVLLMSATSFAAPISGRYRIAMNGPDTTLHPNATPHVHIIFGKGRDRFARISGNVDRALGTADMPAVTRQRLQNILLQGPRKE